MVSIFNPLHLGSVQLKNRVIMAPLTRGRAGNSGVPRDLMAEYYRRRASASLIIAEATAVSADGRGWLNSPGLFNDEQQAGWTKVADAVHQAGGKVFVQLWHMGATVHPDFLDGQNPISSSAIRLTDNLTTPLGRDREFVVPRSLSVEGIAEQVQNFVKAARRAINARLDGVEIHAANGFLIDQFTRDSNNRRTDQYGGNIDNRLRFMREVVAAVRDEIGAEKVGVRLSPSNTVWGISDSEYQSTFTEAAKQLSRFGLAYLHVLEPHPNSGHGMETIDYITPLLRHQFDGPLLVDGGYSKESAQEVLDNDLAEGNTFGAPFIANPDLVERFKKGRTLKPPRSEYFYAAGPEGYTDYEPTAPT